MSRSAALRWGVGALAVVAIAIGGVFANLAVLDNSQADAAIGTLSAKGIRQVNDGPAPTVVLPTGPAPHVDDHHAGDDRDRDDD